MSENSNTVISFGKSDVSYIITDKVITLFDYENNIFKVIIVVPIAIATKKFIKDITRRLLQSRFIEDVHITTGNDDKTTLGIAYVICKLDETYKKVYYIFEASLDDIKKGSDNGTDNGKTKS